MKLETVPRLKTDGDGKDIVIIVTITHVTQYSNCIVMVVITIAIGNDCQYLSLQEQSLSLANSYRVYIYVYNCIHFPTVQLAIGSYNSSI